MCVCPLNSVSWMRFLTSDKFTSVQPICFNLYLQCGLEDLHMCSEEQLGVL